MAKVDKFGFGSSLGIVKADGHLPGEVYGVLGTKIAVPALPDPAETSWQYGFGEIVAVVSDELGAYQIRQLKSTDTTLPSHLGVIQRDRVGGTDVTGGYINYAKPTVAVSLWLLDDIQLGKMTVAFKDTTSAVKGGQVYVGINNGTVGGAVYASSGDGKVALTGWVFDGPEFQPTFTDAKAVAIGRV